MSKLLYVFDARDWHSRIPVADEACKNGINVSLAVINAKEQSFDSDYPITYLQQTGRNLNPLSTLKLIRDMRQLIALENPDIMHVVTLKYSFMAGLAALRFKGTRKIFTLAGLGYVFRSAGWRPKLLKTFLSPVFKFVFKRSLTHLIFQNQDDRNLFIESGYVGESNTTLIKGSGIDLERFKVVCDEQPDQPPLVLMPTRLIREKGIAVFIEAATILKEKGVDAQFQIAGGLTLDNPGALTQADMDALLDGSAVEWLGHVADMPALLARATLIVYPSYYGEGIPRVLLEACAAGKAIITTDHPGCREAIMHGEGGFLVPIKDTYTTAEAIHDLLQNPEQIKSMGERNYRRACTEFDIRVIAERTAKLYDK